MRRAIAGRAALEGVRAATRRLAPAPPPRRPAPAETAVLRRAAAVRSELRRMRPV